MRVDENLSLIKSAAILYNHRGTLLSTSHIKCLVGVKVERIFTLVYTYQNAEVGACSAPRVQMIVKSKH